MPGLRTDDELKNPEFNYYLAYVIDPTEKNADKIKNTMTTKKNTFTQGTPVQRRLKDLYAEAEIIMTTQATRDIEYQNAKKLKMETAKNTAIAIARGRGSIYKSDLKKIADSSGKWLTADEIEKEIEYLKQQGVKIIDDLKTSMDFLTYDKVDKLLKTAGKNDLYDLLGCKASSSPADLQTAITSLYNSITGKSDAKSTAINQISGEAKKVFKDATSKKNYDIYIATKDIWAEFGLRRNTGITAMEMSEYLAYSEKSKTALKPLGITNIDEIEVLLAEGLNYFRIAVAGGSEGGIDLEQCPYCNQAYANIGNPTTCPHCHKPLQVVCWNCGGQAPYTVKKNTCPTCGASKDHQARFDTVIKKIDNLLVQPGISINDIKTELNNLKNILPDYNKATNSQLAKKVVEYQEKVDKKVKEEETTGKAYKEEYEKIIELTSHKKYMSATSAVASLKTKFPIYNLAKTNELTAQIAAEVAKAKQFAEMAKTLAAQNNEDSAVEKVAEAVKICVDYEEAKQIIAKFPPKAPRSVTSTIKENAAMVNWVQERQQKLASFTVIRKSGSAPTSISDGTVVANDLTINFFEDTTIVSDTPYFYGVFASRLGINSPVVATPTAIITYFDVANIRQTIVPGKVSVQWDTPLNVSEVEVIKKKGLTPPSSNTDGQKIPIKNNQSFEDGDYDKAGNSYLFFCVYKNSQGVTHRSKGVTRTFQAFEELKPLYNVKITNNSPTTFTLTSDAVSSGKRGIYYSETEVVLNYNNSLQLAEFKNFYKGLKEASLMGAGDTTATFNLPSDKAFYVYPFVSNEQLIMVSHPVIVNTMIAVSQPSVTSPTRDNEVTITGQPHSQAKNLIVMVSTTAFPTTLASDGIKHTVPATTFAQSGLKVKLKANTTSYVTLFAEAELGGFKSTTYGVQLAPPISIQEQVTIWYKMSDKASNTKPFEIKIEFKADIPTTIPPLTLVKGNPCPLSPSDGQLIDTTEPITLKKGMFSGGSYVGSVSVKCPPVAINTRFALFLSTQNSNITLRQVKSL